jgi:hypothetical protein
MSATQDDTGLTELGLYKACLLVALKKDCDANNGYGLPYGAKKPKKPKYSPAQNIALLAVRHPNLAKEIAHGLHDVEA